MKDFRDRVAVITGAGSGIGRALAHNLAGQGVRGLALVDVAEARLREVERELQGLVRLSIHVLDVSDRAAMQALPDAVLATFGRVDILVNNAGVAVAGDLEEQSLEDFEWLIGINLWGVVYGCRFFLPHLRRSDDAYIVNLSSMFGLIGIPGQSSYCASKFAVRGFSESIAAELADTSIKVMSVHPGGIATNIAKDGRFSERMPHAKIVRFFEKHAMPPERCAELMVRAMRQGRSRLLVTRESHVTDMAKRLFPRLPQRWVAKGSKLFLGKR
ncbi:MAG: SDR family oxidoreductase [Deltaproteobacteria bacterium]|nr:SDR family oxidoreductase [Nannocystaceae bacterium]